MPYHIPCSVTIPDEYSISYTKKNETVAVTAPTKEEVEQLFEWAAAKVKMITVP